MTPKDPRIVSASDVASWAFCPESWRLSELGFRPSNTTSLDRGEAHHAVGCRVERTTSRQARVAWVLLILAALGLAVASIGGLLR
jgi:hypothetical protein